ncbi:helix-turn-helix transcriptional regulator [Acidobacteria bacterium AH-259-L09]|nr:helix-turn-helix transcriptional regulator [Acidobacteria bacterium AH-259-L09]
MTGKPKINRNLPLLRRVRRVARDLTQESLGKKIGKTHGYISQIESGKWKPSKRDARAICQILGSTVKTLFPDVGG